MLISVRIYIVEDNLNEKEKINVPKLEYNYILYAVFGTNMI